MPVHPAWRVQRDERMILRRHRLLRTFEWQWLWGRQRRGPSCRRSCEEVSVGKRREMSTMTRRCLIELLGDAHAHPIFVNPVPLSRTMTFDRLMVGDPT